MFTPAPDFNGDASFKYTVSDGSLSSNEATVTITVDPVLDAKVTLSDGFNAVQYSEVTTDYQQITLNIGTVLNPASLDADETSTVTLRLTSPLPDGVSFTDSTLKSDPDSGGFIYKATGLTAVQARDLVKNLKIEVWDDAMVDGTVTVTSTDVGGNTDTYSSSAYFRVIVTNEQKIDGNVDANTINVVFNTSDTLVQGYGGNDTITGSNFNDWLFGDRGDDVLSGGLGNDKLWGGGGNDTLTGDDGRDTFIFEFADMIYGATATDTITDFGVGDTLKIGDLLPQGTTLAASYDESSTTLTISDDAAGFRESIVLEGYATDEAKRVSILGALAKAGQYDQGYDNLDDYLVGGTDHDTLSGDSDHNVLIGRNGNDSLSGAEGNDLLYGGAGKDTLSGGDGNDMLLGENNDDVLRGDGGDDSLSGGQGNDSLWGGEDADVLSGGNDNDVLMGEGGNDVLMGNSGADSLSGGQGNDTLWGGNGADTFVFRLADNPAGTNDTIKDFRKSEGDMLRFEDVLSVDVQQSGTNSLITVNYTDDSTQTVLVEGFNLPSGTTNHVDNVIMLAG